MTHLVVYEGFHFKIEHPLSLFGIEIRLKPQKGGYTQNIHRVLKLKSPLSWQDFCNFHRLLCFLLNWALSFMALLYNVVQVLMEVQQGARRFVIYFEMYSTPPAGQAQCSPIVPTADHFDRLLSLLLSATLVPEWWACCPEYASFWIFLIGQLLREIQPFLWNYAIKTKLPPSPLCGSVQRSTRKLVGYSIQFVSYLLYLRSTLSSSIRCLPKHYLHYAVDKKVRNFLDLSWTRTSIGTRANAIMHWVNKPRITYIGMLSNAILICKG